VVGVVDGSAVGNEVGVVVGVVDGSAVGNEVGVVVGVVDGSAVGNEVGVVVGVVDGSVVGVVVALTVPLPLLSPLPFPSLFPFALFGMISGNDVGFIVGLDKSTIVLLFLGVFLLDFLVGIDSEGVFFTVFCNEVVIVVGIDFEYLVCKIGDIEGCSLK
jgi:hypothetical protein